MVRLDGPTQAARAEGVGQSERCRLAAQRGLPQPGL